LGQIGLDADLAQRRHRPAAHHTDETHRLPPRPAEFSCSFRARMNPAVSIAATATV
jgi:hypothetical protein